PDGSGLISRCSKQQFPKYEEVLPKAQSEAKVIFWRDELLDGLAKVSATARKSQSPTVLFELSKQPAAIKAAIDGVQSSIHLEHVRVLGKARDIGFNPQYLTEYLKSLKTDTISMTLFPQSVFPAAMFESFRYRHLLMPMRT